MGTKISIKCQNCGYNKRILLGVGMEYYPFENVIYLVPNRSREKILDIFQNHKIVIDERGYRKIDAAHRLLRCFSCNQLHGRYYVKIEYDDNKVYETKFKCSNCKNELKVVEDEEDVKKYPCPECNKKEFTTQLLALWD